MTNFESYEISQGVFSNDVREDFVKFLEFRKKFMLQHVGVVLSEES